MQRHAIALLVVCALAALAYMSAAAHDVAIAADTIVRASRRQDVTVAGDTITYTKTLDDGSVLTYTATRLDGETDEQFAARAAATWAAIKAANGV